MNINPIPDVAFQPNDTVVSRLVTINDVPQPSPASPGVATITAEAQTVTATADVNVSDDPGIVPPKVTATAPDGYVVEVGSPFRPDVNRYPKLWQAEARFSRSEA